MSSSGDVIFTGGTGLSSSTFVRLIRQEALQRGKSKDDDWIAEYAASCLEDSALAWFEAQSDEIQESWRMLRRALLQRWPADSTESGQSTQGRNTPSAPAARSVAPVPAAAPAAAAAPVPAPAAPKAAPAQPSNGIGPRSRVGRVRVCTATGPVGWISSTPDNDGDFLGTTSMSTAMVVRLPADEHPHTLMINNGRLSGSYLSLVWLRHDSVIQSFNNSELRISVVTAAEKSPPRNSRASSWTCKAFGRTGDVRGDIWNVCCDGRIQALWPTGTVNTYRDLCFDVIVSGGTFFCTIVGLSQTASNQVRENTLPRALQGAQWKSCYLRFEEL